MTAYNSSLQRNRKELLSSFLEQLRKGTDLPKEDAQKAYIEES